MCYKIQSRNQSQNIDMFLKTRGLYNEEASLIVKKDKKRFSKTALRYRGIITFLPEMGSSGGGTHQSPFLKILFCFIILFLILSFFYAPREAPRVHPWRGKESQVLFLASPALGPDYDPSTRVTKKGDIRKPYYDRYVTNGKIV